jgi:hypothetical protein
MNSRLRDWCTVPAKRAAGGLSHLQVFSPWGFARCISARFGSPYANVLPRNHLTLKKMGVSDAMEQTLFMYKNLTGTYWVFLIFPWEKLEKFVVQFHILVYKPYSL